MTPVDPELHAPRAAPERAIETFRKGFLRTHLAHSESTLSTVSRVPNTYESPVGPERELEVPDGSGSPRAHLDTTANFELPSGGLFNRELSADPCVDPEIHTHRSREDAVNETANWNNHGVCAAPERASCIHILFFPILP